MSTRSTGYRYLAQNPGSCYKQLFVKGTRIPARTLYGQYVSYEEPQSAEEIAADYGLPLEAVKEAIVYCESNPPELLVDYAREESIMEAYGAMAPDYSGKPKLLSAQELARLMPR
jgi:uncharacterized protein (DUF433 family)